MAVSRNSGRVGPTIPFYRFFNSLSRYDLLLAVLPLGFVFSGLAHLVASIPFLVAVAGGALFGLVVLVDALFVHPPSQEPPRTTQ